jgi:hypothetical protein
MILMKPGALCSGFLFYCGNLSLIILEAGMKRDWIVIFFIVIFLGWMSPVFCEESIEDGTHDAVVTTDSGSYTVPVEVEGGEVTVVHWPNGGDMHVSGAELDGTGASGSNSRGDSIQVEIDD